MSITTGCGPGVQTHEPMEGYFTSCNSVLIGASIKDMDLGKFINVIAKLIYLHKY